jgi:hypothetical protein
MKVLRYSEFSLNESHEEYFKLLEGLDAHYQNMLENGYSEQQINEGIWDLVGSLGAGFTDRMKNYAAGWILKQLGLPSDNNFLSEFAKNIVEQISFRNIGRYFGEGSCKYWIDAIGKGLLETLEEKAIEAILSRGIGLDLNMSGGFLGTLSASVREALTNYINSTKFVESMSDKLEGVVCGGGTSFTSVFGGGKFSVKDIENAAMGKEKNGGILGILGI